MMRIDPLVGTVMPQRMSNSVDLPAPFGPIMPKISPSSTSRLTPFRAVTPPYRLTMSRAETTGRSAAAMVICPPSEPVTQSNAQLMQSAGGKHHDQDDDRREHQDPHVRIEVHSLRYQREHRSADHRSDHQLRAAQQNHQEPVHRVRDAEDLGRDNLRVGNGERTSQRGKRRAQDESLQSDARHIDADRAREMRILADTVHGGAERRPAQG